MAKKTNLASQSVGTTPGGIIPVPNAFYESEVRKLIAIYAQNYKSTTLNGVIDWDRLNKYKDFLTTPQSNKAKRLMKYAGSNGNSHFWYLSYHPTEHKAAIAKLDSDSPWNKISQPNFTNFETWYKHVNQNVLYGIRFIKEVVWYDTSLIMAYLLNQKLMPDELVYVHALPMRAAYAIFRWIGVPKQTVLYNGQLKHHYIPMQNVPACLQGLTAYELEDFFCMVGEAIRATLQNKPCNNLLGPAVAYIIQHLPADEIKELQKV